MNTPQSKRLQDYEQPSVTADCVVIGFDGAALKILLIERGVEPFLGSWALPGGFIKPDETIEQCARRELCEETGITSVDLRQFHVFSCPSRDPRGRVITVAFLALTRPEMQAVRGGDDARIARWFDMDALPPLAFDHLDIIRTAKDYLRDLLKISPAAFSLLPEQFSVDDIRKVYEAINGTTYDRRNFQRKLMQSDLIGEVSDVCENSVMADNASKRSLRRLFSLRRDTPKSDDEGSIKDLFNI